MQNTDIVRNAPRLRPMERLQELHPRERARQTPPEDSPEEAQGQVSPTSDSDMDKLREAVDRINAALSSTESEEAKDPAIPAANRQLKFSVDEATEELVVAIVDEQSKEVIRQIPAEVVLRNMANIERLRGILFHKTA